MMRNRNMKFYFAQEYKDSLYFSSVELNGLFKKEKNSNYAELVRIFDNEDLLQTGLHSRVIMEKDKLIFLPYNGTGISVYDLSTQMMSFLKIPSEKHYASYVNAVKIDERWLLIPQSYEFKFFWFDADSMVLSECKDYSALFEEKIENFLIDIHGSLYTNGKLYIAFYGTTYIGIWDIKNETIQWKSIDEHNIANIEMDKQCVWISTLNGIVVKWNEKKDEICFYKICSSENRLFYSCVSWHEKLLLLPYLSDTIYEFDYERNEWNPISSKYPVEFDRDGDTGLPLIVGYLKKKDELVLFPRSSNGALIVGKKHFNFMEIKCNLRDCEIIEKYPLKAIHRKIEKDGMVEEGNQLRLEYFIKSLCE